MLRIQELVFSGCTMLRDSKETELGSSNQKSFPSAAKILGLFSCHIMHGRVSLTIISSGVDIS